MWKNIIGAHIRRASRNLVMTGLLLIGAVLGLALLNQRYLANFFRGPVVMDRQALLKLGDVASLEKYYVTVQGDEGIDTGVTEVEQTKSKYSYEVKSERVTSKFIALRLDKRLLLVQGSSDEAEKTT